MELRQLQALPELLASTEAFKASERELSIAQRDLQKVLDEYRAALGLYHRTVRRAPAVPTQLLADVLPCVLAHSGAQLPAAAFRGGAVLRAGALSRRRAAAAALVADVGQKVW